MVGMVLPLRYITARYLVKTLWPGQSWMARLSASGTAPEESDDDENSADWACGSGGGKDRMKDTNGLLEYLCPWRLIR